jgi:hypothetical protein
MTGEPEPPNPHEARRLAPVDTQPDAATRPKHKKGPACGAFLEGGAAQESNLPSRGLHDLTGFEDRLGHPARPLQGRAES